VQRF